MMEDRSDSYHFSSYVDFGFEEQKIKQVEKGELAISTVGESSYFHILPSKLGYILGIFSLCF